MGISAEQCSSVNFNPRSLTGATQIGRYEASFFRISIHAPSRERRATLQSAPYGLSYFNPRSLTGATGFWFFQLILIALFQSTLPHGSDLLQAFCAIPAANFNPRSLTGATCPTSTYVVRRFLISIHAPSRERRWPKSYPFCRWRISIHAPSRERQG